ncbi:MAG: DNA polymerase III subunit epsilon [Hyphomicrobium sp.]
MREIVLDTETTGLDPRRGDRLIEIGCIEIVNRIPSGREFHRFINPERDVPAEAQAVHGLSTEFLKDKPLFKAVAKDFLAFIGDDTLVIHNASFDIGFLNAELERLGLGAIGMHRVVDTLQLARRRHPAGPNTLDALCKRYGIDNSKRVKHGALVDSELLAVVYVELLGERQAALSLGNKDAGGRGASSGGAQRGAAVAQTRPRPLPARLTAEDDAAHQKFVETLGPKALWLRIPPASSGSRN